MRNSPAGRARKPASGTSRAVPRLLVVGNCQAECLGMFLGRLCGANVSYRRLLPGTVARMSEGTSFRDLGKDWSKIAEEAAHCDLVLLQRTNGLPERFAAEFPEAASRVRLFPRIDFSGFHPDMIVMGSETPGPASGFYSSLACYAWLQGADVEGALSLFCDEIFERLGFYLARETAERHLLQAGLEANLPLGELLADWNHRGVWMHTINHPKGFVFEGLARAILRREGLPASAPETAGALPDPLASGAVWGVYPEIARRLGVDSAYYFKPGGRSPEDPAAVVYDLEGFVRASYRKYQKLERTDLRSPRLDSPRYQALADFLHGRIRRAASRTVAEGTPSGSNPYRDLPDHRFWRRAMETVPADEVDPVVSAPFSLSPQERVATAGSCFAQHISRTLARHGFNYYVPEDGSGLEPGEATARNYGVFSARYGNLYATRQLLQLFDRAFGTFKPQETCWRRADGRYADPFRPQIEPEGFATPKELADSRRTHFAAVRTMFRHLDVFVFTLGLTESWRSRIDGAVYPLAPGVAAGHMDPERHEFVNFSAAEVAADLDAFIARLRSVNPGCRIILTVSPVPLIATYEDRHVLVSTTSSKAALRVAAEEVCRRNTACAYFPSFEIITGNHARGAYFEDDLRSVRPEGVDHVMRLFMRHYAGFEAAAPASGKISLEEELMRENRALAEVVCDEEAIDEAP